MSTSNATQIDALQEFTKASQELNRATDRLVASRPDAQTVAKATQALQEVHAHAGTALQNIHN